MPMSKIFNADRRERKFAFISNVCFDSTYSPLSWTHCSNRFSSFSIPSRKWPSRPPQNSHLGRNEVIVGAITTAGQEKFKFWEEMIVRPSQIRRIRRMLNDLKIQLVQFSMGQTMHCHGGTTLFFFSFRDVFLEFPPEIRTQEHRKSTSRILSASQKTEAITFPANSAVFGFFGATFCPL